MFQPVSTRSMAIRLAQGLLNPGTETTFAILEFKPYIL